MKLLHLAVALIVSTATLAVSTAAFAAPARQIETDGYTRYELLAPDSHKFRILYEITATTPGATAYYNPIRSGSTASDEQVGDRATGKPLVFREVDGATAKAGGVTDANPENRYIAVTLARPVPRDGGGRIMIEKTYEDAKSYTGVGDNIVFDRSLGILRNAVVLPPGYELTACNVPSQILQQPDGRIMVSFWNASGAPAPLHLEARKAVFSTSSTAGTLPDRATQTRNIVYYLLPPETHSFSLTHDYTETRPGVSAYVNIVRTGSTVANPSASDLDTGAVIPHETVRGAAIKAVEPEAEGVADTTEAVVFRFPAVRRHESRRIRIAETYTDPERYGIKDGDLTWHRSFGRAANAVVLPAGWVLTNSSVPATVSLTSDGKVRLDYLNPRADEIDVLITASRGPG